MTRFKALTHGVSVFIGREVIVIQVPQKPLQHRRLDFLQRHQILNQGENNDNKKRTSRYSSMPEV